MKHGLIVGHRAGPAQQLPDRQMLPFELSLPSDHAGGPGDRRWPPLSAGVDHVGRGVGHQLLIESTKIEAQRVPLSSPDRRQPFPIGRDDGIGPGFEYDSLDHPGEVCPGNIAPNAEVEDLVEAGRSQLAGGVGVGEPFLDVAPGGRQIAEERGGVVEAGIEIGPQFGGSTSREMRQEGPFGLLPQGDPLFEGVGLPT